MLYWNKPEGSCFLNGSVQLYYGLQKHCLPINFHFFTHSSLDSSLPQLHFIHKHLPFNMVHYCSCLPVIVFATFYV